MTWKLARWVKGVDKLWYNILNGITWRNFKRVVWGKRMGWRASWILRLIAIIKNGKMPLRDTKNVERTGQKGETKGQVREFVPTPHYEIHRKTKWKLSESHHATNKLNHQIFFFFVCYKLLKLIEAWSNSKQENVTHTRTELLLKLYACLTIWSF